MTTDAESVDCSHMSVNHGSLIRNIHLIMLENRVGWMKMSGGEGSSPLEAYMQFDEPTRRREMRVPPGTVDPLRRRSGLGELINTILHWTVACGNSSTDQGC